MCAGSDRTGWDVYVYLGWSAFRCDYLISVWRVEARPMPRYVIERLRGVKNVTLSSHRERGEGSRPSPLALVSSWSVPSVSSWSVRSTRAGAHVLEGRRRGDRGSVEIAHLERCQLPEGDLLRSAVAHDDDGEPVTREEPLCHPQDVGLADTLNVLRVVLQEGIRKS